MSLVAESRRGRRLVGRLERGVDVLEGLAEVCRAHHVRAGELRAVGALEQVVLGEFDQRARAPRPPRRFDAAFELLSLAGNVSVEGGRPSVQARVTLSRERDNGIELLGGVLVSGRVFALEFVIECFDDLALERLADPQTGLHLWLKAHPVGEPAPAPVPFEAPARTKWEDVIAASREPEPAPPPPVPVEPAIDFSTEVRAVAGDFIEHPKFGRCQIERIEGDYEFISARLRNQRLIRLSLDVLTLVPMGEAEGHRLFRAESGR